MSRHSVTTITTGVAGCGKTYTRCACFLLDEWLPSPGLGVHYSNFPLKLRELCRVAKSRLGLDEDQVLQRVEVIPEREMAAWRDGSAGPWSYFVGRRTEGCHVAIDEVHTVCGRHHPSKHRAAWQRWLGEVRHAGMCVELISQSPMKIAKELDYEAGLRLSLISWDTRRDPFFGIPVGDWMELYAGFVSGRYESRFSVIEKRNVDGRWVPEQTRSYPMDQELFSVYDSWNAPTSGGVGAKHVRREFEYRSKLSLLGWFLSKHWWPFAWRGVATGVGLYFFLGGGMPVLFSGAADAVASAIVATGKKNNPGAAGVVKVSDGALPSPSSAAAAAGAAAPAAAAPKAPVLVALWNDSACFAGVGWVKNGEVFDFDGRAYSLGAVDVGARVCVLDGRLCRLP